MKTREINRKTVAHYFPFNFMYIKVIIILYKLKNHLVAIFTFIINVPDSVLLYECKAMNRNPKSENCIM